MICFDCAQNQMPRGEVVGICHECGAAVCAEHAVERQRVLIRTATIMREEPVTPAARLIVCRRCCEALVAARRR